MGGRKIYLFATHGSFVSLPLVPPPSRPVSAPGYRGATRCRGGLRVQRLRGILAAHPAEPWDRIPAGSRPPRLRAPRASGARGEPRGTRRYAPRRPANEIGPRRLRSRTGFAGRGAEPRGAQAARSGDRRPPRLLGQEARPVGEAALPLEPSAVADKSRYRRKAACSGTFCGVSPRHRTGGTARPDRGHSQLRWAPGDRGIPRRRDESGGAQRPEAQARLCPALPRAAAVGPSAVRSREYPQHSQPSLRAALCSTNPSSCSVWPRRQTLCLVGTACREQHGAWLLIFTRRDLAVPPKINAKQTHTFPTFFFFFFSRTITV